MDHDFEEVSCIPHPGPGRHSLPTAVTALAFDPSQELLWTGNQFGRVMSFYGRDFQRYTSYKGHTSEPVKQILFTDKGVLSISAKSIHLASRKGLTQWHLTDDNFRELHCMSFTSKGTNEVLVAGRQATMFKVDLEKGIITETLPAEDNYTIMKKGGQYICAANDSGAIHILDSNTMKIIKIWQAHSGFINDMDVKSDFIVTCGSSPRQQMVFMPDGLANVFDLKTLQPLPPIPFQAGAAFVRMHPRMSTTSIVGSINGQLQVVDIMNPNAVSLIKQVNVYDTNMITSMEMAPSGEALALSTSHSQIHLWGSPSKINFTEYHNETVFPDQVVPHAPMDWSLDTPLNTIGIPFYREVLLSAWPSHMVFDLGAPPVKIDPAFTATLKRSEMGHYGPNPRKTRRNQIASTREVDKTTSIAAPKFLHEKMRDAARASGGEADARRINDAVDLLNDLALDGTTKKDVPIIYRNVEIKYSKFGVDDFDFEYYNRTKFSGLETHIVNSYANPLLQLFRFTPIIRNLGLHHTATACLFDSCLLCELGFLIDMLEKAAGQNCQATNFLKTFTSLSSAMSLNLLEEHSPNTPLTVLIQSVNRFLLEKFSQDCRQMDPTRKIEQAVSTKMTATIRCQHCTHEQVQSQDLYYHELIYPPKPMTRSSRSPPRPTFSQILKASVERQEQTRGWCSRCRRYQQMTQRKQVQQVPAVLMINTMIQNGDARATWATPGWLPQEIGIIAGNGQFFCYEGEDLRLHIQRGVHNVQVLELIGVVADVNSGENQRPHLVSVINVSPSSLNHSATDEWHLFNDFLVRQIPKEEALRFDPSWKLPSVLTYQIKLASHQIDDSWKQRLDTSILYKMWGPIQDDTQTPLRPLNPRTEPPLPGTLCGIDAEFVSLQAEEIEIKADGQRQTIRPSRLGLARVSVLRGAGIDADVPFIDDYICITETIADHLTKHSGISPGDLDRGISRHVLVSLKVAYKKLWLLLNLGVVFVGHGLIKDFRTVNIHVPKRQVVDTVELWYDKSKVRKLSLRFLCWVLLREDIQMDMHDSVEDARTALKLYRKYLEYVDAGVFQRQLEWVYKEGAKFKYKVPERDGEGSNSLGVQGMGTPGRVTPDMGNRPGSRGTSGTGITGGDGGDGPRSEVGTPGRFGRGGGLGMGFGGSPMR
ncbi:PAB-dependent poly(A)-specific ribonuclease subunit pan2 [Tothia fuscella]|uniref:PAN2-PAN3 deadenylation complex catalytic subunit PAN2 n=1 Tax=Tothia fuscella TaxID=1048955 RepID=A0A9P4NGW5_9PEZI|nr:PAB-dependent poly(A)-specific ribonuclease subunit pan2 [Tothia fuscella]